MTIEERLLKFVNQYLNVPNVGDTDANKGQCVGLIEVWTDQLGLPHTWGNAKDLLANADPKAFDVIYNNPQDTNQFPLPGDVLVYGPTWGAGVGHTGVVCVATGTSIVLFEQNNPVGHAPEVATRNSYIGVTGWLHPKMDSAIIAQPLLEDIEKEIDRIYLNL